MKLRFVAAILMASVFVACAHQPEREPASKSDPPIPDVSFQKLAAEFTDGSRELTQEQFAELLQLLNGHCNGTLSLRESTLVISNSKNKLVEQPIDWDVRGRNQAAMDDMPLPKISRTWLDNHGGVNFWNLISPGYFRRSAQTYRDPRIQSAVVVWWFQPKGREVGLLGLIELDEKTRQPIRASFTGRNLPNSVLCKF